MKPVSRHSYSIKECIKDYQKTGKYKVVAIKAHKKWAKRLHRRVLKKLTEKELDSEY